MKKWGEASLPLALWNKNRVAHYKTIGWGHTGRQIRPLGQGSMVDADTENKIAQTIHKEENSAQNLFGLCGVRLSCSKLILHTHYIRPFILIAWSLSFVDFWHGRRLGFLEDNAHTLMYYPFSSQGSPNGLAHGFMSHERYWTCDQGFEGSFLPPPSSLELLSPVNFAASTGVLSNFGKGPR